MSTAIVTSVAGAASTVTAAASAATLHADALLSVCRFLTLPELALACKCSSDWRAAALRVKAGGGRKESTHWGVTSQQLREMLRCPLRHHALSLTLRDDSLNEHATEIFSQLRALSDAAPQITELSFSLFLPSLTDDHPTIAFPPSCTDLFINVYPPRRDAGEQLLQSAGSPQPLTLLACVTRLFAACSQLPSLRKLIFSLRGSPELLVTGAMIHCLSLCTALTEFSFQDGREEWSDGAVKALRQCQSLSKLTMGGNKITDRVFHLLTAPTLPASASEAEIAAAAAAEMQPQQEASGDATVEDQAEDDLEPEEDALWLESLGLNETLITESNAPFLRRMLGLTTLRARTFQLRDVSFLANLTNLRIASVHCGEIVDPQSLVSGLSACSDLMFLELLHSCMAGAHLSALVPHLPGLWSLALHCAALDSLAWVASLPERLNTLALNDGQLPNADAELLFRALPSLRTLKLLQCFLEPLSDASVTELNARGFGEFLQYPKYIPEFVNDAPDDEPEPNDDGGEDGCAAEAQENQQQGVGGEDEAAAVPAAAAAAAEVPPAAPLVGVELNPGPPSTATTPTLHRDAVHSVAAFLPLEEVALVNGVNRSWRSACATLPHRHESAYNWSIARLRNLAASPPFRRHFGVVSNLDFNATFGPLSDAGLRSALAKFDRLRDSFGALKDSNAGLLQALAKIDGLRELTFNIDVSSELGAAAAASFKFPSQLSSLHVKLWFGHTDGGVLRIRPAEEALSDVAALVQSIASSAPQLESLEFSARDSIPPDDYADAAHVSALQPLLAMPELRALKLCDKIFFAEIATNDAGWDVLHALSRRALRFLTFQTQQSMSVERLRHAAAAATRAGQPWGLTDLNLWGLTIDDEAGVVWTDVFRHFPALQVFEAGDLFLPDLRALFACFTDLRQVLLRCDERVSLPLLAEALRGQRLLEKAVLCIYGGTDDGVALLLASLGPQLHELTLSLESDSLHSISYLASPALANLHSSVSRLELKSLPSRTTARDVQLALAPFQALEFCSLPYSQSRPPAIESYFTPGSAEWHQPLPDDLANQLVVFEGKGGGGDDDDEGAVEGGENAAAAEHGGAEDGGDVEVPALDDVPAPPLVGVEPNPGPPKSTTESVWSAPQDSAGAEASAATAAAAASSDLKRNAELSSEQLYGPNRKRRRLPKISDGAMAANCSADSLHIVLSFLSITEAAAAARSCQSWFGAAQKERCFSQRGLQGNYSDRVLPLFPSEAEFLCVESSRLRNLICKAEWNTCQSWRQLRRLECLAGLTDLSALVTPLGMMRQPTPTYPDCSRSDHVLPFPAILRRLHLFMAIAALASLSTSLDAVALRCPLLHAFSFQSVDSRARIEYAPLLRLTSSLRDLTLPLFDDSAAVAVVKQLRLTTLHLPDFHWTSESVHALLDPPSPLRESLCHFIDARITPALMQALVATGVSLTALEPIRISPVTLPSLHRFPLLQRLRVRGFDSGLTSATSIVPHLISLSTLIHVLFVRIKFELADFALLFRESKLPALASCAFDECRLPSLKSMQQSTVLVELQLIECGLNWSQINEICRLRLRSLILDRAFRKSSTPGPSMIHSLRVPSLTMPTLRHFEFVDHNRDDSGSGSDVDSGDDDDAESEVDAEEAALDDVPAPRLVGVELNPGPPKSTKRAPVEPALAAVAAAVVATAPLGTVDAAASAADILELLSADAADGSTAGLSKSQLKQREKHLKRLAKIRTEEEAVVWPVLRDILDALWIGSHALHRDMLMEVFSLLALDDFARASAVSRLWTAAAQQQTGGFKLIDPSMGQLRALVRISNQTGRTPLHCERLTAVLHSTGASSRLADCMSRDLMLQLGARLSALDSLDVALDVYSFIDGDAAEVLALPPRLTSIGVRFVWPPNTHAAHHSGAWHGVLQITQQIGGLVALRRVVLDFTPFQPGPKGPFLSTAPPHALLPIVGEKALPLLECFTLLSVAAPKQADSWDSFWADWKGGPPWLFASLLARPRLRRVELQVEALEHDAAQRFMRARDWEVVLRNNKTLEVLAPELPSDASEASPPASRLVGVETNPGPPNHAAAPTLHRDRDALHSVLAFLTLTELSCVSSVSRVWHSAFLSLAPLRYALSLAGSSRPHTSRPSLSTQLELLLSRPHIARHVGSLRCSAAVWSEEGLTVTNAQLEMIGQRMPALTSLLLSLYVLDYHATIDWNFPSSLVELTLQVYTPSANRVSGVATAAAPLTPAWQRVADFTRALQQRCPALRTLLLQCEVFESQKAGQAEARVMPLLIAQSIAALPLLASFRWSQQHTPNQWPTEVWSALCGGASLTELSVQRGSFDVNEMHTLTSVPELSKLRRFGFGDTAIHATNVHCLSHFRALTALECSWERCDDAVASRALSQLTQLRSVQIYGWNAPSTESLLRMLASCPQLTHVHINSSHLKSPLLTALVVNLPALTSLSLPNCKLVRSIGFIDAPHLASTMRFLSVRACEEVSLDDALPVLLKLRSLTQLDIRESFIGDVKDHPIFLPQLRTLPHLTQCNFGQNDGDRTFPACGLTPFQTAGSQTTPPASRLVEVETDPGPPKTSSGDSMDVTSAASGAKWSGYKRVLDDDAEADYSGKKSKPSEARVAVHCSADSLHVILSFLSIAEAVAAARSCQSWYSAAQKERCFSQRGLQGDYSDRALPPFPSEAGFLCVESSRLRNLICKAEWNTGQSWKQIHRLECLAGLTSLQVIVTPLALMHQPTAAYPDPSRSDHVMPFPATLRRLELHMRVASPASLGMCLDATTLRCPLLHAFILQNPHILTRADYSPLLRLASSLRELAVPLFRDSAAVAVVNQLRLTTLALAGFKWNNESIHALLDPPSPLRESLRCIEFGGIEVTAELMRSLVEVNVSSLTQLEPLVIYRDALALLPRFLLLQRMHLPCSEVVPSSAVVPHLLPLSALFHVTLGQVHFSAADLALFFDGKHLPALSMIQFDRCKLPSLEAMQQCTTLTDLRFSSCDLERFHLDEIIRLTALRSLRFIRVFPKDASPLSIMIESLRVPSAVMPSLKFFESVPRPQLTGWRRQQYDSDDSGGENHWSPRTEHSDDEAEDPPAPPLVGVELNPGPTFLAALSTMVRQGFAAAAAFSGHKRSADASSENADGRSGKKSKLGGKAGAIAANCSADSLHCILAFLSLAEAVAAARTCQSWFSAAQKERCFSQRGLQGNYSDRALPPSDWAIQFRYAETSRLRNLICKAEWNTRQRWRLIHRLECMSGLTDLRLTVTQLAVHEPTPAYPDSSRSDHVMPFRRHCDDSTCRWESGVRRRWAWPRCGDAALPAAPLVETSASACLRPLRLQSAPPTHFEPPRSVSFSPSEFGRRSSREADEPHQTSAAWLQVDE